MKSDYLFEILLLAICSKTDSEATAIESSSYHTGSRVKSLFKSLLPLGINGMVKKKIYLELM